ncbi:unnamed protein product [Urochloa humidicola]
MQEPDAMESEFTAIDTRFIFKRLLTARDTGTPVLSKEWWGLPEEEIVLPPWLSKEYIGHVAAKFNEMGFSGAMNFYRCLDLNWELMAPWTGADVAVPTKFVVGETAMAHMNMAAQEYILNGGLKGDVPGPEEVAAGSTSTSIWREGG